jgi:hypothetical protein
LIYPQCIVQSYMIQRQHSYNTGIMKFIGIKSFNVSLCVKDISCFFLTELLDNYKLYLKSKRCKHWGIHCLTKRSLFVLSRPCDFNLLTSIEVIFWLQSIPNTNLGLFLLKLLIGQERGVVPTDYRFVFIGRTTSIWFAKLKSITEISLQKPVYYLQYKILK